MTETGSNSSGGDSGPELAAGPFAPLGVPIFRNLWFGSVFANFGRLILGVGAAWEMTRLTNNSPSMVALVQSAMMLPLALLALPAGAIADMFDRRKVAIWGLLFSGASATIMTALAYLGWLSPWMLLGFCVLIGAGVALFFPSWQASIGEIVPPRMLASAIALGSISFNIARTAGPAIGGAIILTLGASATFMVNALCYVPLIVMLWLWKREHVPSRLPREPITRAMVSGGRYAFHHPIVRNVLVRAFSFGLASATGMALAPLAAKNLLGGDAAVFGFLLGAIGVGAVSGVFMLARVSARFSGEAIVATNAVLTGLSLIVIGYSHSLPITLAAYFVTGASNIITIALLNVTIQLSVPRWVVARVLSLFTACVTGGVALGAWGWGNVAAQMDVTYAFVLSGVASAATVLLGLVARLPDRSSDDSASELVQLNREPEVALPINMRSGPVIIEIHYEVDPDDARAFYDVMQKLQKSRKRNGAFNWTLSRDVADAAIWTEAYHLPTWGDYLRMRDRWTQADMGLHKRAAAFHRHPGGPRIRRMLDRPFGSVRWKADTPDPGDDRIDVYPS